MARIVANRQKAFAVQLTTGWSCWRALLHLCEEKDVEFVWLKSKLLYDEAATFA